MASIRTYDGPTGKRNDFEEAASYLLPYDPVAKQRTAGHKRDKGFISGVDFEDDENDPNTSSSRSGWRQKKPSIGKTGVHFRYYKPAEYQKLTAEQRMELKEWRESNPEALRSAKKKQKSNKKRLQKTVSQ